MLYGFDNYTIMASSSREIPIYHQHISGITGRDGAQIFAGTNTTTNHNIYNGWYALSKY